MTIQETGLLEKKEQYSPVLESIASAMVEQSLMVKEGERVLIWLDKPLGYVFGYVLRDKCLQKGAKPFFFCRDFLKDAGVAANAPLLEIEHYFDKEKRLIEKADKILIVRCPENPEVLGSVPQERRDLYLQKYAEAHRRRVKLEVPWTLILWPTQYEADQEGLPYPEYFKLFLEACDQPWAEIKQAQAVLKEKLDWGEELEIFVNEQDPDPRRRTHLKMSIRGMTFANSTIDCNFPGSEVFSAPVLNSVEGQLFAPGVYVQDGVRMSDILLKIENGKIVEVQAAEGNEGLQEILGRGEGARYFGEIAFGTNPGLTRRFFNDLLKEKTGGSFHMAIGHCYDLKRYDGCPVMVNNGNTAEKTSVHWDLAVLMHPAFGGGRVILDGRVIQENGKFLDPELAILNPKI